MPKWKKDETRFVVRVSYDDKKGNIVRLPAPIAELLGRPERLRFTVKKGKKSKDKVSVVVEAEADSPRVEEESP